MPLTVDTDHLLFVKMTKEDDAVAAKLYLASGGGGTAHLFNVRDSANVAAFAGLVASSVNDPRKLVLRHKDISALGAESYVKHYLHVIIGGLQYTLLSQIEGNMADGWNIFSGEVARDSTNHIENPIVTKDYYVTYGQSLLFNSNLAPCRIDWNFGGARDTTVTVWPRIDGVDQSPAVGPTDAFSASAGHAFFTPSDGVHTIGLHVRYKTNSLFSQIKGETWVSAIAQNESNAGDAP